MDPLDKDSENELYTETSESDDEDSESSYGGHAQSILSNLDESIGKIDDFLSFERGFAHGDIVCAVTDPSGQLGRVVDVDMTVELETICGRLIKDVNTKKLLRLKSFVSGDHIVKGPWLGRVDRVFDVVTVLFGDGAKCEILVRDTEVLTPVSHSLEDMPFPYYPGQRVRIKAISESATWLCGSQKKNQDEGTVCHVDVGLLYINWLTSLNFDSVHSPPPPFQDPKDLTLLSCFSYANWQLGDWCTLPVGNSKNLSTTFKRVEAPSTAPKCFADMQKDIAMNAQQMYMVAKTKIKVDIMWQNGEMSLGVDPQTLSPVNNVGDHDFWPEQYVLEKVTSEDVDVSKLRRMGIVKSVDSHERTVKVKWIGLNFEQIGENGGPVKEEIVSVYELIEHPDFTFCIGDVVITYWHGDGQIQTNDFSIPKNCSYNGENIAHDSETRNKGAQNYLSCIGNVIGYKEEMIEVKWASGTISTVPPVEVIGLDRLLDAAPLSSVNAEVHPANIGKEIEDQARQLWNGKEKKVSTDEGEDCLKYLLKAGVLSFPRAAFWLFSQFATNLFKSCGSTSVSCSNKEEYQSLTAQELPPTIQLQNLNHKTQNTVAVHVQNSSRQTQETKHSEEPTSLSDDSKLKKCKQFDIASNYSDHHFVDGSGNNLVTKSWLKKVQQEWYILKCDLPDSIYIRVYEERMDLLRACIVGAPGTPYHDGLFFFDIFFPPGYPHEPPVVHYISGGLRLNPNLYESGKVCLSLLKTWMGTGSEVWNPRSSTILQLLLSLQALVLNEKPYYNEAGYDEQIGRIESEKNSITYNENAFIQSCKSMLYIMHKPPKNFEELVKEHFSRRSYHILGACKAYLSGAPVGHPYDCEKVTSEGQGPCSTGFKIMLAKLFPKLVTAFTNIGVDCSLYG